MSPFVSSSGLSLGSREAKVQRAKVCLNCTEPRVSRFDCSWDVVRNTISRPFMTPCARQVMNRIPRDLTPSWAGCWGPPNEQSSILISTEKLTTSKADPQTEAPTTPRQGNRWSNVTFARSIVSTPQWSRSPLVWKKGNAGILLKVREMSGKKILSGKSFLKLSIVSWIFASKQVRYWVGVCSVSNMKYIVTDDALLHSYPHHWQYGNDTLNMPSGAEECCELSGNFTLFGELSSWVIIPTVSSGATWTLSLRNFLWTCSTQVESTFATSKVLHIDITATLSQTRVENPKEQGNLRSELHTDITGLKNSCTVRALLVTFTCAAIWRVHL